MEKNNTKTDVVKEYLRLMEEYAAISGEEEHGN
jgi:hypothetical protein